jgi:hypothetical protein
MSRRKRTTYYVVAAVLAALNGTMLFAPSPGQAAVGACGSAKSCSSNKCSGKCIGGTRSDCSCCSGLCWVCGDDC